MKTIDHERQSGWLGRRFDAFDRRLEAILGEGRISRREKKARANQAAEAVNDLIEGIAAEIGNLDERTRG